MVFCPAFSHDTDTRRIHLSLLIPKHIFCLANSVIFWVAHESSFFKLSIGRDNQVP